MIWDFRKNTGAGGVSAWIPITAETSTPLSSSIDAGWQWSFGDGMVASFTGVVTPFASKLKQLTVNTVSAVSANVGVRVYVDAVQVGSVVILNGMTKGLASFDYNIPIGSTISFRTSNSNLASGGGVVTAWLQNI